MPKRLPRRRRAADGDSVHVDSRVAVDRSGCGVLNSLAVEAPIRAAWIDASVRVEVYVGEASCPREILVELPPRASDVYQLRDGKFARRWIFLPGITEPLDNIAR